MAIHNEKGREACFQFPDRTQKWHYPASASTTSPASAAASSAAASSAAAPDQSITEFQHYPDALTLSYAATSVRNHHHDYNSSFRNSY